MGFNLFGKKRTNPVTGEQHRSGLRKIFHGAHGLEKAVRPVVKPVLPVAGSIIGGMFGGPLGAVAGGAIGGGLSSKKHPLDHALGGAAVGLGNAFLAPKLGAAFGVNPESAWGRGMMMQHPSLMNQLGFGGGSGAMGGGLGLAQAMSGGNARRQAEENAQAQQSASGFNMRDLMDAGLLGTAVAGTLMGRTKQPKEPSINEILAASKPKWGPQDQPKHLSALNRRYLSPPQGYRPGTDPEWQFLYDEGEEPPQFAEGGYIKESDTGGQDDDINRKLPVGAYVMNATDVSLLGDGSSENGAKKLNQFEDNFERSGITKHFRSGGRGEINAKVSNDEYVISPDVVTALGRGDNRKGAKIIDKARLKLRRQKGVKKILPPKSKPLHHYIG